MIPKDDVKRIIELRDEGMSETSIAKYLSVGRGTVRRILGKDGDRFMPVICDDLSVRQRRDLINALPRV